MKKRLVAVLLVLIAVFSLVTTVYAIIPGIGGEPPILPTSIELPYPEIDDTESSI